MSGRGCLVGLSTWNHWGSLRCFRTWGPDRKRSLAVCVLRPRVPSFQLSYSEPGTFGSYSIVSCNQSASAASQRATFDLSSRPEGMLFC